MDEKIVRGIVRELEGSVSIPLVKAKVRVVGENKKEHEEFRVTNRETITPSAKVMFRGTMKHSPADKEEPVKEKEIPVKEDVKMHDELIVKSSSKDKDELPRPNINNLPKSISKISNMIESYLHQEDIHSKCASYLKGKMYADEFYRRVQNCIYKTLCNYCQIESDEQKNIILPKVDQINDRGVLSTLVFFDRIYNDRSVSFEKDVYKVMPNYREKFSDGTDGISAEWIDSLIARIKVKFNGIGQVAINNIVDSIKGMWTNHPTPNVTTVVSDSTEYDSSEEKPEPIKCDCGCEEHSEDGINIGVSVHIGFGEPGTFDIIRLESADDNGSISLPLYASIEDIVPDEEDGWNFLMLLQPHMIFKTRTPDKYLAINDVSLDESSVRCVVMKEEDGTSYIGVYIVNAIYRGQLDDEEEELIAGDDAEESAEIISAVVRKANIMDNPYISFKDRALHDESLYQEEDEMLGLLDQIDESIDESADEEVVDEEESNDDLSSAVLRGIMNDSTVPYDDPHDYDASADHEESYDEYDEEEEPEMVAIADADPEDEEEFTFQPVRRKR